MIRKYAALLLTVLLLAQPLSVAADGAFNDGVMDWNDCAHAYDNACDPDCNVCGGVRAGVVHTYDHGCDDTCNVCGTVRVTKGHIYDNDADVTCNACGAFRLPQTPDGEYTPGDVSEDGAVNNKDLVLLIRYLNGWRVRINVFAADADGDGAISMKDAARLQQYVNGWDVEIG